MRYPWQKLSSVEALAACSLTVFLGGSGAAALAAGGAAAAVDGTRLDHADQDAGNWLTYGRTYSEQRYSPLTRITADNVNHVGLAWFADLDTNRGQEATPIVIDGVMYVSTAWSMVKAYDAASGKLLWSYDPQVPRRLGVNGCCDVVSRGVAAWNGKIFVATFDGRLVALDATSGKPVWSVLTIDPAKPYTITQAPRVIKGRIVIGNAGAEYGVRGYISAYDAETGKFVWRFYTVPGDPSKPFENQAMAKAAKTWSGEWWKLGGGGTVWESLSYDPALNLIYFGVSNGVEWNHTVRSAGKGDNLFLSSIVAVNADTGEYVWHYQATPGEEWDYDAVQQLTLADLKIDGVSRQVLMQANKNGFFYVLDRISGEFISAQPFSRVTWAKGIDQKTGRPIINTEVKYGTDPVPVSPGGGGAHNWSPMSFNPQTGLVYVPTRGWDTFTYAADLDFKPDPSRAGPGQTGLKSNTAGLTRKPTGPAIGPEPLEGGNLGTLVAYDPVKQEIRWRVPVGNSRYGGTLSTASNLLFQVAPDGRLIAYSADKGDKLLEIATGIRNGMGPPITFTVDGKQYIALMGGSGGTPSPGVSQGTLTSMKPRLLVFGLDGKAELPKPAAGPAPAAVDPHQE